jgi:hypothetical protein
MKTRIYILPILIMLTSFTYHDKDKLIALLKEYKYLNIEYSKAYNQKNFDRQKEIGEKIENLHEEKLLPSLIEIEEEFCKSKDKEILISYLEMIAVIGHSASEAPRWTLGKLYICQPEFVLQTIDKHPEKKIMLNDLEFGFENVIYEVDSAKINIPELRKKIEEKRK